MILIDLSQTIIANCIVHKLGDKNLIKHSTFSSLLAIKKKYGRQYGSLVLACDSNTYWRRGYFSAYKGHRKHHREASILDWNIIFEAITEIKNDLRDYFTYKILEVPGCEADDVIATLVKYTQENELVNEGLFGGEPQPTLVVSADSDFAQLQKYKNVSQWSNSQKKKIVVSSNYLFEHIATGDVGDNIPNVLTNDDWSVSRANNESAVRQKPMKKQRLDEFKTLGATACKDDNERRNWVRNQNLIDFDFIPKSIGAAVIDVYINYNMIGSKTKLMNYFVKNKMRLLINELNNF